MNKQLIRILKICILTIGLVCLFCLFSWYGLIWFIDSIYTQKTMGEIEQLGMIPKIGRYFEDIKSQSSFKYLIVSDKTTSIYVAGFIKQSDYDAINNLFGVQYVTRVSGENYTNIPKEFTALLTTDMNFFENDLMSYTFNEGIGYVQTDYRINDGLFYMFIDYRGDSISLAQANEQEGFRGKSESKK